MPGALPPPFAVTVPPEMTYVPMPAPSEPPMPAALSLPVAVTVPPAIVTVPKPLPFAAPMPEPYSPPFATIVQPSIVSLPVPLVSPTMPPMPGAFAPPVAVTVPLSNAKPMSEPTCSVEPSRTWIAGRFEQPVNAFSPMNSSHDVLPLFVE